MDGLPKLRFWLAHAIVDLVVYFGVRDYVSDAERRGIKPQLKQLAGGSRTLSSL
jgi:hypothetical protein